MSKGKGKGLAAPGRKRIQKKSLRAEDSGLSNGQCLVDSYASSKRPRMEGSDYEARSRLER